jgi:hypothetical protein
MKFLNLSAVAAAVVLTIAVPLAAQPVPGPGSDGGYSTKMSPTARASNARANGGAVVALHCYNSHNPDCD